MSDLSSFHSAGLQAAGADMHSLGTAVYLALYTSDIGIPDSVGSSMRMAYIVTEMNALATNITLSHLDTSSMRMHQFLINSQHCYINRKKYGMQAEI